MLCDVCEKSQGTASCSTVTEMQVNDKVSIENKTSRLVQSTENQISVFNQGLRWPFCISSMGSLQRGMQISKNW